MTNNTLSNQSIGRVRKHTASSVNQTIDEKTAARVREYASKPAAEISEQIQHLESEWDTERVLEANASVLAFTGLMLGIFVNANWFWLTGVVLPFLFQHAVQGWCPPLPVIRRLGTRTKGEIDQEIYALKILRGDFNNLSVENDALGRANQALQAVGIGE
ncbi:MAG: hypothetical protein VKK04_11045 [Synechococcales bacterium]|nr:hypothetical protein [Synechococcales bacterium]